MIYIQSIEEFIRYWVGRAKLPEIRSLRRRDLQGASLLSCSAGQQENPGCDQGNHLDHLEPDVGVVGAGARSFLQRDHRPYLAHRSVGSLNHVNETVAAVSKRHG
jgi:hypothetical protein